MFYRIMVLDDGKVQEFGPPSELLARNDSFFRGFVDESGLLLPPQSVTSSAEDQGTQSTALPSSNLTEEPIVEIRNGGKTDSSSSTV